MSPSDEVDSANWSFRSVSPLFLVQSVTLSFTHFFQCPSTVCPSLSVLQYFSGVAPLFKGRGDKTESTAQKVKYFLYILCAYWEREREKHTMNSRENIYSCFLRLTFDSTLISDNFSSPLLNISRLQVCFQDKEQAVKSVWWEGCVYVKVYVWMGSDSREQTGSGMQGLFSPLVTTFLFIFFRYFIKARQTATPF